MNILLVSSIYNRASYLKRFLYSLSAASLQNSLFTARPLLIDDGSTDSEVKRLLSLYSFPYLSQPNGGMYNALSNAINFSLSTRHNSSFSSSSNINNFTHICILDSDTIQKEDFLQALCSLASLYPSSVITGFNTPNHPVKEVLKTPFLHYRKETCGGINLLFPLSLWKPLDSLLHKFNNGWDHAFNRYCLSEGIPIYCTAPSCIQHIGIEGLHSSSKKYDVALDYE